MKKILLSIKPKYVKKILNKEKIFELRKNFPKENIDEIYIYSSYPEKKIVGKFIPKKIIMEKEKFFKEYEKYLGISKEEFDKYYQKKEKVFVYKIQNLEIFKNYIELKDLNIKTAPQNFLYIK